SQSDAGANAGTLDGVQEGRRAGESDDAAGGSAGAGCAKAGARVGGSAPGAATEQSPGPRGGSHSASVPGVAKGVECEVHLAGAGSVHRERLDGSGENRPGGTGVKCGGGVPDAQSVRRRRGAVPGRCEGGDPARRRAAVRDEEGREDSSNGVTRYRNPSTSMRVFTLRVTAR